MRAPAEAQMVKQQWAEPQPNWLPLRQAVLAADSVDKLAEYLKREARASHVQVDSLRLIFSFNFGDGTDQFRISGPPWEIVARKTRDARDIDIEDVFEIYAGPEEAAKLRQISRSMAVRRISARKVVEAVWCELRATFDRKVSRQIVSLYSRPDLKSPFAPLPPDVWRYLDVDWKSGKAIAPDGTVFWSIHVQRSAAGVSTDGIRRGRTPSINWEVVDVEVFRLMDYHGEFMTGDPNWNVKARLEEEIRNFIETKFDTKPTTSTIRAHVSSALINWRSRKAGK
jgi:hypothetical protein